MRISWAALFTLCATLVGASPAFAQIIINASQPQTGSTHGDSLSVVAAVGPYSPSLTVKATVAGRSTTLFLSLHRGWVGALVLTGLPSGEHTLLIEASNTNGDTAQTQIPFLYDPSPVLTLTEPLQFALAQPDIPIKGTCVDDKGICTVKVVATSSPSPLISTTLAVLSVGSFDTAVTPPAGEQILTLTPMDATSQGVSIERKIFVSQAGGLSVEATFQGALLDVDASRALTFDNTVSPSVVRLYDRIGNTNQIIWTAAAADEVVNAASLTPGNGALFVVETPSTALDPLVEWRGGALTQVAHASPTSLIVKGAWAVFNGYIDLCCAPHGLFIRDLAAGTNTHLSTTASAPHVDVTPNGRAVFITPVPYEIQQFDSQPPPGATTTLTSGAPLWSLGPLSDGINVVFTRMPSVNATRSIVLRTAAGVEEVLATELITANPGSASPTGRCASCRPAVPHGSTRSARPATSCSAPSRARAS
jgi:hypothetical protein